MIVNFYKVKVNNYRDMELLATKNIEVPYIGMGVDFNGQRFKIVHVIYSLNTGEYAALITRV